MLRFFQLLIFSVLFWNVFSVAVTEDEAITHSTKMVQDKGILLHRTSDELLEYVRQIKARHVSGDKFSYYDFFDLNKRVDAWKKILLAECGYITKQQEENWSFRGAGYGDDHVCFCQHRNMQACLSVLQHEKRDDKITEALDLLEKEIRIIVDDSMIAAKEANKCAAQWIDKWLHNNGHLSVRDMMQKYRNNARAEPTDDFLQCWYSGEFWNRTSFNINDKLECVMFILLSERANFAATFGGRGLSKGGAYCFAPDYTEGLSHSLQKHFAEDELMLSFLRNRLSPDNRFNICLVIFPLEELDWTVP